MTEHDLAALSIKAVVALLMLAVVMGVAFTLQIEAGDWFRFFLDTKEPGGLQGPAAPTLTSLRLGL